MLLHFPVLREIKLIGRGHQMLPRVFPVALAIGFVAVASASAQTVGRTTSVKPGAFRNSAALSTGAPVATDDLVNTDAQGRTNLRFLDLSTLDIGPGSDVRIDRFVFDPARTAAGVGGGAPSCGRCRPATPPPPHPASPNGPRRTRTPHSAATQH